MHTQSFLGKAGAVLLAGAGLLLGSLGCNPAQLLLSSAGSHCREQCGAGPACGSLGDPSVEILVVLALLVEPVGAVPPQGIPGGALLHLGPGGHLHIPGLSSEALLRFGCQKNKVMSKALGFPCFRQVLVSAEQDTWKPLEWEWLASVPLTPVLNRLLVTFYTKPPHLGAKCLLRSNFFQWDFSVYSSTLLIRCPSY